MRTLDDFANINDKMIWKNAALDQIKQFKALAERLCVVPEVVGSHHSKSIELPVVRLEINGKAILLRDNFYDVNVCVVSPEPIELSLHGIFEGVLKELDWDWYLGEIARCRGYTWDYFTDEEMEDPRILRVFKLHKHGKPGDEPTEWNVRADQKDRWLKRMTCPEWWEKDWAGNKLCWDGAFGPGVRMFAQPHPFMQGIDAVASAGASQPYHLGCKMFSLAVGDMETSEKIIRRVCGLPESEKKDGTGEVGAA